MLGQPTISYHSDRSTFLLWPSLAPLSMPQPSSSPTMPPTPTTSSKTPSTIHETPYHHHLHHQLLNPQRHQHHVAGMIHVATSLPIFLETTRKGCELPCIKHILHTSWQCLPLCCRVIVFSCNWGFWFFFFSFSFFLCFFEIMSTWSCWLMIFTVSHPNN
jgi:hypothetical protein